MHRFVGYFIGSPGMNFLACRLDGDGVRIEGTDAMLGGHWHKAASEFPERQAGAGHPPGVRGGDRTADGTTLPAKVERVEDLGNYKLVTARLGAHAVKAKLAEGAEVPSEGAHLSFSAVAHPALCRRPADRVTRLGMNKTQNNAAWFLVLPVLVLVAFSAIIPLMTVVNYSVQDIFGPGPAGLGRHRMVSRRCSATTASTTRCGGSSCSRALSC